MEVWHFCASPVDVSREQGGVSNVVRALAVESAAADTPTRIVCGNRELGHIRQPPGEVFAGRNLRIRTLLQRANPALGPIREVSAAVDQIPVGSVAHVHACFSAFTEAAMVFLFRRGVPFVFSAHGKFANAALDQRAIQKRLWWRMLSRRNIGRARCIGVLAEGEASDLRRLNVTAPVVTIPNGYTPPPDDVCSREPRLISDPYILYLGYLDPRKQPDLLIRAFSRCRARHRVRLVLVGPDTYGWGRHLNTLAAQEGVAERVVFYGPAYGDEKWNLLGGAKCLCLPSRAEGMPLVLAEAVGAATPSMFTPECNAADIASAGAGLEVPGGSPEAWAEALDHLLDCEDRLESMRQAAERLRPSYAWQSIAARWLEVYRSVARGEVGHS